MSEKPGRFLSRKLLEKLIRKFDEVFVTIFDDNTAEVVYAWGEVYDGLDFRGWQHSKCETYRGVDRSCLNLIKKMDPSLPTIYPEGSDYRSNTLYRLLLEDLPRR